MWKESDTCYYSLEAQGTDLWKSLRIGRLTGSVINSYLGMSKFSQGEEESALQCLGLSKKEFTQDQIVNMEIGSKGEGLIRQWYSNYIGQPIEEVGLAVWKKDLRFGSSLDGLYGNKGIEIKISKEVYNPLIENGYIWPSHYDQMVQAMAISGLQSIDYIVAGHQTNQILIKTIYPDPERWKQLYTKGVEFLDNYVEPRIK